MIRAWNDPAFAHLRGLRIRLSPISKARAQTLDKGIIKISMLSSWQELNFDPTKIISSKDWLDPKTWTLSKKKFFELVSISVKMMFGASEGGKGEVQSTTLGNYSSKLTTTAALNGCF